MTTKEQKELVREQLDLVMKVINAKSAQGLSAGKIKSERRIHDDVISWIIEEGFYAEIADDSKNCIYIYWNSVSNQYETKALEAKRVTIKAQIKLIKEAIQKEQKTNPNLSGFRFYLKASPYNLGADLLIQYPEVVKMFQDYPEVTEMLKNNPESVEKLKEESFYERLGYVTFERYYICSEVVDMLEDYPEVAEIFIKENLHTVFGKSAYRRGVIYPEVVEAIKKEGFKAKTVRENNVIVISK